MANSIEEEMELRRGPWTLEEDTLLIHYIATHGEGRWNLLANSSGLKRTGKSCRLRWLNYLKPDIKRGNLTPQEQLSILQLHSKWGNRWSKIAQHLPGRTDNEIKNYWRTRVQKQARQLNIDSNSNKFLDAVRHFWMPRLLEKAEQNSPSPSSSSSLVSSTSILKTRKNQNLPPESKHALAITQPIKREKSLDWYKEKPFSNPEHQTSSPSADQAHGNIPYKDSRAEDCYIVDISSFDMDGFNQDKSSVGSHSVIMSDCQMAEADWISEDLGCSFWNMDELWEIRK